MYQWRMINQQETEKIFGRPRGFLAEHSKAGLCQGRLTAQAPQTWPGFPGHIKTCADVSRISHATVAPDCWRKKIPQKWWKLILPFGSERLPQWIATLQNIHVKKFYLFLPAQTWQYKRMILKFYLVLFRLPWPEQGGNIPNQLSYLQEAHSALQHNPPDLQVSVPHFGVTALELRAPWVSVFTQSCVISAENAKAVGAFASHILLKIKTKNSKGFWKFEVKSSPEELIMKSLNESYGISLQQKNEV